MKRAYPKCLQCKGRTNVKTQTDSGRRVRSGMAIAVRKFLWSAGAAILLVTPFAKMASAQVPILPLQVSTNPGNGDQNPYGVVFTPPFFPNNTVQFGDVLVANFNDAANNQGQGTTIINIRPDRTSALFAKVPTPGLTAAMGTLRAGFVLIGSITVPKPSNFPLAVGGPITVLDSNGKLVTTIASTTFLDGPWGMAVNDQGTTAIVFVSNVLNGTVIRINLTLSPTFHVDSITKIGVGYDHVNTNATPLVGPSGLAYSVELHTLYVSVGSCKFYAIANADTLTSPVLLGTLIWANGLHLHGPLGLAIAPNGDLISAQADNFNANPAFPSEIVEFTKTGQFVAQFSIDAAVGAAFNIALAQNPDPLVPVKFAYVNDAENNLNLIYLPTWGLW
jgi:hypothetical protein